MNTLKALLSQRAAPYIVFILLYATYCIALGDIQRNAIGLQGVQERYGMNLVLDESGYITIADNLSHGSGYRIGWPEGRPTAWRPPVYPMLLAALFRLFGTYAALGLILNALLILAMIWLTGLACNGYVAMNAPAQEDRCGIAQWLVVLVPSLYFFASLVQTEALAIFLGAAIIAQLFWIASFQGEWRWGFGWEDLPIRLIVLGLTCGIAYLSRPELAITIPLIGLILVVWGLKRKWNLKPLVWFLLCALVFPTIWMLYNFHNLGALVPSTTMGGTVFYGAHNDDTWNSSPGSWGNPPRILGNVVYTQISQAGEVVRDKTLYKMGLDWVLQRSPFEIIRLEIYKLARLWVPYEFVTSEALGRLPSLIASALFLPFWALSITGMLILIKRHEYTALTILLLMPIANTVTALLMYGTARYRVSSYPALAVLAAIGSTYVINVFRNKRFGHDIRNRSSL